MHTHGAKHSHSRIHIFPIPTESRFAKYIVCDLPSISVKAEEALEMVDTELISCSPISSVSSPTPEPSDIVCCCCRWLGFIISRAWIGKRKQPHPPSQKKVFITSICARLCMHKAHVLTILSMFSL